MRFEIALFVVIHQPRHARLFDRVQITASGSRSASETIVARGQDAYFLRKQDIQRYSGSRKPQKTQNTIPGETVSSTFRF